MKQLTKEQVRTIKEGKLYEKMSARQCAAFQMEQEIVFLPFPILHASIDFVLGRSVTINEFGDMEKLRKEVLDKQPSPTFEQALAIMGL